MLLHLCSIGEGSLLHAARITRPRLTASFCYLTVVLLLASIVRQGFIYLVLLLTPIESSMRLPYSPTVFTGGVGLSFDTVLAYLGGVDS